MASGYPTPTGFFRLTGCQRDPQDRGVTPREPKPGGLKGSKTGQRAWSAQELKYFFFLILTYPSNLKFNTHTKLYLYLTYIINF